MSRARPSIPLDDGPGELFVFVPGLMGAGILLSGAILLADGVRRVLPDWGERRRVLVARGVQGVVVRAATAAGYGVQRAELLRRELRSRWAYLAVLATSGAIGALIVRAAIGAYLGSVEPQRHSPWMIGIAIVSGGPFALVAALAFLLAALHRRAPASVRRLVSSSWLGRLSPTPEDPAERARLLLSVPSWDGSEQERTAS